MATNPQCQDRVFDELHDIFGASHRPCSSDNLSYMKYLEYCMKESSRIYSSAALFERKMNKDIKLGTMKFQPKIRNDWGEGDFVNSYTSLQIPVISFITAIDTLFPRDTETNPNQPVMQPVQTSMHIVISKRRETIFSFYSLQKYTSLFWNNVFKRIFSFTSVYRRETNNFMTLSDFKMVCILYKLCVWRGPWDFFLFDYSFEG